MIQKAFSITPTPESVVRELQVAREIAQAFLTATHPTEVYSIALERVVPLVEAAFGCVFLREESNDLLQVVAAHDWPGPYTDYLTALRVRVGNGPTGRAVAENRVIEVQDIFADPALEDWWEAARELGFASSISLPLAFHGEPIGAITFYFHEPEELNEADRSLLRLVADQLAATAEKAHLISDLQQANAQLREQNIELEARYQEAEEARRLKNEFLANVSHELRTPLTAILGYAYLLREGLTGPLGKDQTAGIEKIEGAATNLMGLINDLLDLTHLKLGRTIVEIERCDGVALARAALSMLPSPPTIEVKTEAPPEPVVLYTDPVQVLRILRNLLSNAYKFTSQGEVVLRVRSLSERGHTTEADTAEAGTVPEAGSAMKPRHKQVVWEVQDTGIGIAPDDHERIFDEFRQVDGSATRRFGGTGLGLALSRGLARRLGGDITVRSTPGEGATFSLVLPVAITTEDQEQLDAFMQDDSPEPTSAP